MSTRSALTVFDALRLAADTGTRLDHRRYLADEATERNDPAGGVCWRLITRHHLDPCDQAQRVWARGHEAHALNLLAGEWVTAAVRYQISRDLGLSVRTLWVPGPVLSAADRFHLHALALHARYGFDVRVLDHRQQHTLGFVPGLVAYPRRGLVYLLHHTPQGCPDGATRLRHPRLARRVNDHLLQLTDHAVDIDRYARTYR